MIWVSETVRGETPADHHKYESTSTRENMTEITASKPSLVTSSGRVTSGRLFVLDVSGGRILSMRPDGSDRKVIVTGGRHPDGIVIHVSARHGYWTDMG